METLSEIALQRAGDFLLTEGRELEQARFSYHFQGESSIEVIRALQRYQNQDGGFGNGLEPDFRLPDSSPLATAVAFQILGELDDVSGAEELIQKGIAYLEETYHPARKGWFAVPAEVNQYPHAPWWNYDQASGMTAIDQSWGNPSAELIGYLYRYREYAQKLDVDGLVQEALEHLLKMEEFSSEHEMYCYVAFYKMLPAEIQAKMVHQLTKAVQSLVVTDPSGWAEYAPEPTKFVTAPTSPAFGLKPQELDVNLDYLVDLLEKEGVIYPNWQWGQYEEAWKQARLDWAGVWTLRVLRVLNDFGRIELGD